MSDRTEHDIATAVPGVPIVHMDERIVVVDKPTGLLSVPGIGPDKADCLAARVAASIAGARIVHRLDRDTSGIMVMARDAEAHRELSRQFHDREVEKIYVATVGGNVANDEGVIDLAIRKDLDDPPRQIVDLERGKPSLTKWRVLRREGDRTMLELRPRTGRSHQLRLHLQAVGHPILGDDLYASSVELAMADRLMLHAESLSIIHPSDASPQTFVSPCPWQQA